MFSLLPSKLLNIEAPKVAVCGDIAAGITSGSVMRIGILVTKAYGPVMRNTLFAPKRGRYLRSVWMVGLRSYDHGRLEPMQKFCMAILVVHIL